MGTPWSARRWAKVCRNEYGLTSVRSNSSPSGPTRGGRSRSQVRMRSQKVMGLKGFTPRGLRLRVGNRASWEVGVPGKRSRAGLVGLG